MFCVVVYCCSFFLHLFNLFHSFFSILLFLHSFFTYFSVLFCVLLSSWPPVLSVCDSPVPATKMGCAASVDTATPNTNTTYTDTAGGAAPSKQPEHKPQQSQSVAAPTTASAVKLQVPGGAEPSQHQTPPATASASAPGPVVHTKPAPVAPIAEQKLAPIPASPVAASPSSVVVVAPSPAAGADAKADKPARVIVVTVWQGKDIKKVDLLSASDPYLKVRCSHGAEPAGATPQHEKKTSVKEDSKDPIWSERLKFTFEPHEPIPTTITVSCMDRNTLTSDVLIGTATIPVTAAMWAADAPAPTPEWRQLEGAAPKAGGAKEITGRIQLTVKCQEVHNHQSSDFFRFDYTHLMSVTLIEGRGLKPMELVGKNSPYSVVGWGNKCYKTKVAPESNDPKWNQECVFWVDQEKQQHYDLSVVVWDRDRLTADDHIGAAYIRVIKQYLSPHQEVKAPADGKGAEAKTAAGSGGASGGAAEAKELVFDVWVPLAHASETDKDLEVGKAKAARQARKLNAVAAPAMPDSELTKSDEKSAAAVSVEVKAAPSSAASAAPPGGPATSAKPPVKTAASTVDEKFGEVHLRISITPKSLIEKNFYSQLLKEFGSTGSDPSKPAGFDRSAIHALLSAMDVHLSESEFEHWFNAADSDHNQTISETEIVPLLRSLESSSEHSAARIWKYLANHCQFGSTSSSHGSLLMEGITQPRSDDFIWVRERSHGRQVKENIPKYISVALKSMFGTGAARYLTNLSTSIQLAQSASVSQGKKYNDPASKKEIAPFIALHGIPVDEVAKPIAEYANFNEFFARALKPEARPIAKADRDDPRVCLSPADCRLMVFKDLIEATQLWIKGDQFTMANVLGPSKAHLADRYQGGSMVIARLSPQDYHRWHIPVNSTLGDRVPIPGALFTVNPIAINKNVNVYTKNKREIIELESDEFGKVLIVPVGAVMVGSITILKQKGEKVAKGDPHGYFQFGGSTVLLFFEPNTIQFDPDLLYFSSQRIETLLRVNTRIGTSIRHMTDNDKKMQAEIARIATLVPPVMSLGDQKMAPPPPADGPLPLPKGRLTLVVMRGKNLKDMDVLSKMDPYVIVRCGKQEFKTPVQKGAGVNPNFQNVSFTFDVDGTQDTVYVNVMDEDIGSTTGDDHIGRVDLSIPVLVSTGIQRVQAYPLFNARDEMTGELIIKCESWVDASGAVAGVAASNGVMMSGGSAGSGGKGGADGAALIPAGQPIPLPVATAIALSKGGAILSMPVGRLSIMIEKGRNLKDMDAVGKMDPYVILKCGTSEYKTKVMKAAGCNPIFNLSFNLYVSACLRSAFPC